MIRRTLSRLPDDTRGAAIVEFALVAVPFLAVVMGLIDIGYREYVATVLHGTLNEAARRVTVGSVDIRTVDAFVRERMRGFSNDISIEKSSYTRFGQIKRPEKITSDTPPLGSYNAGDCFEDTNLNGNWDSNGSGVTGTGNSDDVIYYTAKASFDAIVPARALLGWSTRESVTSTMAMRNQPYASQPQTPVVCD